jgi:tripartite-type tricarboxylate transporter receptor subunit TctC
MDLQRASASDPHDSTDGWRGPDRQSPTARPPRSVRSRALAAVACFAASVPSFVTPAANAQAYPTRPIRLVILSTPGSGPDIVGRLVSQRLAEAWGQQVVVDPRPGASGIIGAEIAARAAPDGHTLSIHTTASVILSVMYEKLPFDLLRDFSPIVLMASTPFLLVAHPGVPANSMAELIAHARSRPGEMRYGSGGSGSPPHLSAEMLRTMTGIDIQHIPYKGVTPALADTIGGQIHWMITVVPAALAAMKAGRVKALGITSAKRSSLLPDVPAIAETVPGYEYTGFYMLFAPAKTPRPIIDRLNAEVQAALRTPAMRDRLADLGAEPIGSTPAEAASFLSGQLGKLRDLVKVSGARADR